MIEGRENERVMLQQQHPVRTMLFGRAHTMAAAIALTGVVGQGCAKSDGDSAQMQRIETNISPLAIDDLQLLSVEKLTLQYDNLREANTRYLGDQADYVVGSCVESGDEEDCAVGVSDTVQVVVGSSSLATIARPDSWEDELEVSKQELTRANALCDAGDNDPIHLTVELLSPEFDFTRMRGARGDAEAIASLAVERQLQLALARRPFEVELSERGGQVVHTMRSANRFEVLAPPCSIRELGTRWPQAIFDSVNHTGKSDNVNGLERRHSFGLDDEANPFVAELDGGIGSTRSGGSRVKFGVIESNNSLNTSHKSFLSTSSSGSTRITDTDYCEWFITGRWCINSATTTASTHGTGVTSILLSDLTDTQVSGMTMVDEQKQTGSAPEANIHYYSTEFMEDAAQAIEEANLDNGVDIINLSMSSTVAALCSNGSSDGTNPAAKAATQAGVLVVAAAGNNGALTTCNVTALATTPHTMAIGGTLDSTDLASLSSAGRHAGASWGSANTTLHGGATATIRPIDLAANYSVTLPAGAGTTGTSSGSGTSYAAPAIAGLAGLLKHWADDRGGLSGLETDPYSLRTLLNVMGDGAAGAGSSPTNFAYTVDQHLGFGHLRFVDLDTELGAGGAWGLRRFSALNGSVHEWSVGSSGAESSAVEGWKLAVLWESDNYGGSPDVTVQLVDKCPAGGGEQILRTAAKHALRQRIRIKDDELSSLVHGRCLYVRVSINSSSGAVTMHAADYYYTNSRASHDMD